MSMIVITIFALTIVITISVKFHCIKFHFPLIASSKPCVGLPVHLCRAGLFIDFNWYSIFTGTQVTRERERETHRKVLSKRGFHIWYQGTGYVGLVRVWKYYHQLALEGSMGLRVRGVGGLKDLVLWGILMTSQSNDNDGHDKKVMTRMRRVCFVAVTFLLVTLPVCDNCDSCNSLPARNSCNRPKQPDNCSKW